eukprot:359632-Chlamydomonas_euryale.AAC.5
MGAAPTGFPNDHGLATPSTGDNMSTAAGAGSAASKRKRPPAGRGRGRGRGRGAGGAKRGRVPASEHDFDDSDRAAPGDGAGDVGGSDDDLLIVEDGDGPAARSQAAGEVTTQAPPQVGPPLPPRCRRSHRWAHTSHHGVRGCSGHDAGAATMVAFTTTHRDRKRKMGVATGRDGEEQNATGRE